MSGPRDFGARERNSVEIRLLSAQEVRSALPMRDAIDAMRTAFGALSAGNATMPLRGQLPTPDGVTLLMPAHIKGMSEMSIKIASIYGGNPDLGLPTIAAVIVLLDAETGFPIAIMDGSEITGIRTGAGGGLAAEYLAREDSRVVALFGAGVQARAQLDALIVVRPIEEVRIVTRSLESAQALADDIAKWEEPLEVKLGMDPASAVRGADIVVAATTSYSPVFPGDAMDDGTHINGIGSYAADMQEVDEVAVSRASTIVVDSRESAKAEAGDLIVANAEVTGELGDLVNGVIQGRQNDSEITMYKCVGVAVQDLTAAKVVLANAAEMGLGTVVEL